ncbi:GIN domain-containing protein [Hwangdonia sp.]|uniref:GIN domain-containing protein n=1 Tax=Hwangdonia sp. TaxID=1883432 RepID=UPI003AB52850
MNKTLLSLLFTFSICFATQAQNTEKVKGNRNVTVLRTPINSFHSIIVDEDFEIEIIFNKEPSVLVETDENLHEFITFNVRDSVLTFNKTKRITSKKRLNIKVNYDGALRHIETRENGEILSLATMDLNNASLKTIGSSKAGLTIQSNNFNMESLDKSKVKLNLTADSTQIVLNGYSKLEALIQSPVLKADLYQRTNATIEGDCDNLLLRTDNNSQFNGKNFTVTNCSLSSETSSDVTLEVTDNISVSLSGSSALYLYNNPKIIIEKFANTSKIQKREK